MFSEMISFVVLAVIIICISLVLYFQRAHSFFKRNHFPALKPNFFTGNIGDILWMRKPFGLCMADLYKQLEPYKYGGVYFVTRPVLIIRDPELIRTIFIQNFRSFPNRGIEYQKGETLHDNLFRMKGDEWKNARKKLNSFFSLLNVRNMVESMQKCAYKLGQSLDQTNNEPFDVKILSEQYTLDVIGQTAFGVEFSAMDDQNCLIRQMANRIFQFRFQTIFRHVIPNPPKFVIKLFNLSYMDRVVEEFFTTMMTDILNLRRRSLNLENDLVTLLLRNKSWNSSRPSGTDDDDTSMEFKIAQCYLFFSAGYETTSTTLAYTMMEFALHQKIQNKVREEIIQTLAKHDGQITYNSMKEMTYTDMVIEESLRLHPPATILGRKCLKPFQIPNSENIIPHNMAIIVSIYGLHTDKNYYENPDEFYPEHFTKEAKSKRPACAYLPFGSGPRGCIAEQFGKMEIKLAIINMIKDYVFEISPRMKFPVKYVHDMKLGLLIPSDGIWLQCKKF